MNTPAWPEPWFDGAMRGAASLGVVGFTGSGRMTGGTAQDRAMTMARNDVVMAKIPVRFDVSRTDPGRVAKRAGTRDASVCQCGDALIEAGWATGPGAGAPGGDIARTCLAVLGLDASAELPESAADEG